MNKYTVKFFSKYNFSSSITIKNVSREDCQNIQNCFNSRAILTQNVELVTPLSSQIDLSCIAYIEYQLQKEENELSNNN